MKLSKEIMAQIFVQPGHITQDHLEYVVKKAEEQNQTIETILVQEGPLPETNVARLIADHFGYKFIDLQDQSIPTDIIMIIPEAVARNQHVVAFAQNDTTLSIATTTIENYELIQLLEKKTGKQVEVFYTTESGILQALQGYRGDIRAEMNHLITLLDQDTHNETAIIKLVNLILEYAYENQASDIHIEPLENRASVRLRIDGILHEIITYPKPLHETIVFRLKIMSRLRIDEQSATQDGRFEFRSDVAKFDVRVSIVPTTHGENVVMRLLTTESARNVKLEDLGYSSEKTAILKRAIEKPYGMILSVGPTGSGKSTTLYTLLQILNRPEVNIMTIEDPVEFNIEHIQQIPVNVKKNVTFATGLRSIVRQDPDIVMVGEIRDSETANISVNAAMTGHLVLSTLHANDAATTFPRLIDLGVEPFLVASSMNVVVSQRLVRKICKKCRSGYFLSEEEKIVVGQNPEIAEKINSLSGNRPLGEILFYHGTGCDDCNQTGYTGRVGIFEIFEINQDLRSLIIQKSSADSIEKKAREMGMESMAADGVEKMFQGITTLEEIIRVTKSQ